MHVRHMTPKCEDKIALSQARLDWDKAHYDHTEMNVPALVKFANELPFLPGGDIGTNSAFMQSHGHTSNGQSGIHTGSNSGVSVSMTSHHNSPALAMEEGQESSRVTSSDTTDIN